MESTQKVSPAAALEEIRERYAARIGDVERLLAALDAVLEQHQRVDRGYDLLPICGTCHKGFWPCPTYQAISRALEGNGQ